MTGIPVRPKAGCCCPYSMWEYATESSAVEPEALLFDAPKLGSRIARKRPAECTGSPFRRGSVFGFGVVFLLFADRCQASKPCLPGSEERNPISPDDQDQNDTGDGRPIDTS